LCKKTERREGPYARFRAATPDDTDLLLPHVAAFFDEEGISVPPPQLRDNLAAMLADPASAFHLAEEGDPAATGKTLQGFVSLTFCRGLEFGLSAEIEDLYVTPAHRDRGLARALMDHAVAHCRGRGVREILVVITPEGEARFGLTGFYRKWGFAPLERTLMIKPLEGAGG
jgi:ribosomal protein S18 acetylase RimI-like enzyme